MLTNSLPRSAAWTHTDARLGFEVAFFRSAGDAWLIEGCTTAFEIDRTWAVQYSIVVNSDWTTHRAEIATLSDIGDRRVVLEADGAGHWLLNGDRDERFDGCLDIDLESSAMTNALPVHRLGLAIGAGAASPAVYVRAFDLSVERLEQMYTRTTDKGSNQQYEYAAPLFGFACRLRYDDYGLVLAYPGLAVRTH